MRQLSGQSAEADTMPASPDKTRRFLDVLRSKPHTYWGLPLRTYQRWTAGDVPEMVEQLVERPSLAWAVARASEELRARGQSKETGEE